MATVIGQRQSRGGSAADLREVGPLVHSFKALLRQITEVARATRGTKSMPFDMGSDFGMCEIFLEEQLSLLEVLFVDFPAAKNDVRAAHRSLCQALRAKYAEKMMTLEQAELHIEAGLDFIVAAETDPTMINMELWGDRSLAVEKAVRDGDIFLKHRHGGSQPRFIKADKNFTKLTWATSKGSLRGAKGHVKFTEIVEVQKGSASTHYTHSTKNAGENLALHAKCLTIQTGMRTLDLEADSQDKRDRFVSLFRDAMLVNKLKGENQALRDAVSSQSTVVVRSVMTEWRGEPLPQVRGGGREAAGVMIRAQGRVGCGSRRGY